MMVGNKCNFWNVKNEFIYFTYKDEKKKGDIEYKKDESLEKVSTECYNQDCYV